MKNRASFAFGFLALIFVGAIVLSSPWARAEGEWGSFMSALFTACSSVCVTGLTVVDIGSEFTRQGQIALMVLVELGCLGLMTCGTFMLIAIGRRLSLSREFSLMNAYGVAGVQGLKSLICWVVGSMLVIEAIGAAILNYHLHDWYQSIFYSVMGFCNAGFSLQADSLASFANDPLVVLTLAAETILGGIGFMVIYNICTFYFQRRKSGGKGRLSLHTKVVLKFSFILTIIAFAVVALTEWNGTLGEFSVMKKMWVAFYQAITPRTCGFSIIPTETLHPFTRLVYEGLMFIGGAPGSAAAGVKVTTLAVLVYTLAAMCRGEQDTVICAKVVPYDIVRESIVIFVALVALVALVIGALFLTENVGIIPSDALFFEAVSAITTTGLSVGDTTRNLSAEGQVVIMIAMFLGRLGALTVVMIIGDRETKSYVRYPSEELVVG